MRERGREGERERGREGERERGREGERENSETFSGLDARASFLAMRETSAFKASLLEGLGSRFLGFRV